MPETLIAASPRAWIRLPFDCLKSGLICAVDRLACGYLDEVACFSNGLLLVGQQGLEKLVRDLLWLLFQKDEINFV